jgi:hypothetical protein
MEGSALFQLVGNYWWLAFPLAWGLATLWQSWLRHVRARQGLQVIKSYLDQGKEPPPDLLKLINGQDRAPRSAAERARQCLIAGLFMTVLAVAFAVHLVARSQAGDHGPVASVLFVQVLLVGFAAALFLSAALLRRSAAGRDRD